MGKTSFIFTLCGRNYGFDKNSLSSARKLNYEPVLRPPRRKTKWFLNKACHLLEKNGKTFQFQGFPKKIKKTKEEELLKVGDLMLKKIFIKDK